MTKNPALERLTKVTDIWTTRLVIAVIMAAFVLSYMALLALAMEAGYHWSLAWLWPLVMDGVIVITSLALVKRQMRGDKTGYVWFLLILFDGVSIFLNGSAGYTGNTLTGWSFALVHALPPLTMVLTLKLLTGEIKDDSRHAEAVQTLDELTAQAETERAKLDDLTAKNTALETKQADLESEIKELQKQRREAKKGDRSAPAATSDKTKEAAYRFLADAHSEGREPSGADVGRHIGRSDSLGRKLKREFWPEITNGHQNGQGVSDG